MTDDEKKERNEQGVLRSTDGRHVILCPCPQVFLSVGDEDWVGRSDDPHHAWWEALLTAAATQHSVDFALLMAEFAYAFYHPPGMRAPRRNFEAWVGAMLLRWLEAGCRVGDKERIAHWAAVVHAREQQEEVRLAAVKD